MREFLLTYIVSGDGIVVEVKCRAVGILDAVNFAKLYLHHMLTWDKDIDTIDVESLDTDEYIRLEKDCNNKWSM